jgi:acyl carrier protein
MADLKQRVTEIIIKKLGVEESQITDEASFTKDLGADSLDTVELIMEFEKAFDITIEDSDAERIQTVGNVVAYLQEKLG